MQVTKISCYQREKQLIAAMLLNMMLWEQTESSTEHDRFTANVTALISKAWETLFVSLVPILVKSQSQFHHWYPLLCQAAFVSPYFFLGLIVGVHSLTKCSTMQLVVCICIYLCVCVWVSECIYVFKTWEGKQVISFTFPSAKEIRMVNVAFWKLCKE